MTRDANRTTGLPAALRTVGGLVVGTAALGLLARDDCGLGAAAADAPRRVGGASLPPCDGEVLAAADTRPSSPAASDRDAPSVGGGATRATAGGAVRRRANVFSGAAEEEDVAPVGSTFRLKLHWEKGYYWQESHEETWWCMACGDGGRCQEGDVLRLVNCKNDDSAGVAFAVDRTRKGDRLEAAGTGLCLARGRKRSVALRPCRSGDRRQLFKGFQPGGKFDLKPARDKNRRCLTQYHHPKAGEEVYAETCRKAHRTKTGYWVQY